MNPLCANCQSNDLVGSSALKKCSRCQLVEYCSRECQIQHWKSGGHKLNCFTPEERSVKSNPYVGKETSVDSDSQVCPLCRDPFSSNVKMVALPCGHVHHTTCLEKMLSFGESRSCPLCRAELPPGDVLSWDATCANCHAVRCADGTPLLKCNRCKSASYCRRECQREHWKHGGHKDICALFTTNVQMNPCFPHMHQSHLSYSVLSNSCPLAPKPHRKRQTARKPLIP
jgi:hypothetical protein